MKQLPHEMEDLKYALHLFLSVDLVGSTAYKSQISARTDGSQLEWVEVFDKFYKYFPNDLREGVRLEANKYPRLKLSYRDVGLWKCLGDELIFQAAVGTRDEVGIYLDVFCRVLRSREKSIIEDSKNKVRFKGSAWIASSPMPNLVRRINAETTSSLIASEIDFVGPEIDAGFRMSKAAKEGFLIVSLELAELVGANLRSRLPIYHVGWESFKGVLADKPYPIFWIPFREEYSEENKKDAHAPWANHLCHFTKEFLSKPSVSNRQLTKLIKEFRKHHFDFPLFKKEFREHKLPSKVKEEMRKMRENLANFDLSKRESEQAF